MYSNEDYERFYIRYTTEALPHGESIQAYYLKNNVPYNLFQINTPYTEMSEIEKSKLIIYLQELHEEQKRQIRE